MGLLVACSAGGAGAQSLEQSGGSVAAGAGSLDTQGGSAGAGGAAGTIAHSIGGRDRPIPGILGRECSGQLGTPDPGAECAPLDNALQDAGVVGSPSQGMFTPQTLCVSFGALYRCAFECLAELDYANYAVANGCTGPDLPHDGTCFCGLFGGTCVAHPERPDDSRRWCLPE